MPLEDLKTTVRLRHPRNIDELKQFYSTSGYRNILWRLLLLKAIIHNSIIKSVFTFQSYNILNSIKFSKFELFVGNSVTPTRRQHEE